MLTILSHQQQLRPQQVHYVWKRQRTRRFWDVTRVRYASAYSTKPLPSAQRVTCSSRNRRAYKTLMQIGGSLFKLLLLFPKQNLQNANKNKGLWKHTPTCSTHSNTNNSARQDFRDHLGSAIISVCLRCV